jgi:hypothetical protein
MCYVERMSRTFVLSVLGLVLSLAFGLWVMARFLSPCKPAYSLQFVRADAHDNGYLLPPAGFSHFRRAVYDLVQGRIRFFEMEESTGRFVHYALADVRSAACIERRLFDAHLAGLPMPEGSCISATEVPETTSRYLIEAAAGASNKAPDTIAIRDRQAGKLLAHYRKRDGILRRLVGLFSGAFCDRAESPPQLPLWNITSFVFPDRWGRTLDLTDLGRIGQELDPDAAAPELLPPPLWVQRKLAEEGRLDRTSCTLPGWMGETEVHVLELERGPLEITARLDAESDSAGVVLVDVYAPDKVVVILAHAQGPTVWHVHESPRSNLVAMLVRGHHGQAVVGLTPYTRILMSTQLHNPYTHCTEQELRDIEDRVSQQYGITRTQQQNPRQDPPVVRYTVGEPMPDGAQLFHHDRSLSDFELRDE